MKKLIIGLFFFFGCAGIQSQDYRTMIISPFGTLNNTDNSIILPNHMAQDMLNVDITEYGSIKKRDGYGLAYTLDHTTSAVHGIYHFYDSSGNDVSLFFNDVDMISEVNGSSTTLFQGKTFGATYQCTDSEGYAYCVNSSRDGLFKTDGATYSDIGPSSTGTMITSTVERLAMAGFVAAPNRLDVSEANDFSDWTPAGEPTDPIQFKIVSPGPELRHITYAFGRIMWFKDESFGYLMEGPTQTDWTLRIVSHNIGTLNNTSVYYNGILYFQAQDSHFYAYDGASLTKLSKDISSITDDIQVNTTNSWTETSSADFDNGYFINGVSVDTETVANQLQMTFPDAFASFRDGTSGTKVVWEEGGSTLGSGSGDASVSGGELVIQTDQNIGFYTVGFVEPLPSFSAGTTFHFEIVDYPFYVSQTPYLAFTLTNSSTLADVPAGLSERLELIIQSTSAGKIFINYIKEDEGNICADNTSSTKCGSIYDQPATFDFFVDASNYQLKINDILVSSLTHNLAAGSIYAYFSLTDSNQGTNRIVNIDDFGVKPSTMSYYSEVHNAANLTAWGSFVGNKSDDGGTHDIYIRAATETFTSDSSTPSWVSATFGTIPTMSTGSFIQMRDDFSIAYATQAPALYDFTFNWQEGSVEDKTYAVYHEDAIWWAVASGAGVTANNYILRLDLFNRGWGLYNIGMNGMLIKDNNLFFGSVSSGYIYQFGSATNDNGSDIEAYWKSKDYPVSSLFTEKEFNRVSVAAASDAGSNVTLTYELDGSTSTNYSIGLEDANSDFIKNNRNLAAGETGQTINFKIGNDAADQPFEIFGIQFGYRSKPWRPTE